MSRSTVLSRSTGGLELDRGRGVSSHKEQGVVMKTPAEASSAFSLHRTPPPHEASRGSCPQHQPSSLGGGLHLLGGVPVPGIVVVLAVLLRPESADVPVLLEVFGSLLCLSERDGHGG